MPVVIPGVAPSTAVTAPTIGGGNGLANQHFIAQVRRIMRDQAAWVQESPAADGTTGGYGVPTAKPIRLTRSPILRSGFALSAPGPALNATGFAQWQPVFDPQSPDFLPTLGRTGVAGAEFGNPFPGQVPNITKIAGGGTWLAGTYAINYTQIFADGTERGMSEQSNLLTINANDQIVLQGMTGFTSGISKIWPYITYASAGGNSVGRLTQIPVINGISSPGAFNSPVGQGGAPMDGSLPALIITDTGEMWFVQAPGSGTVNAQYQTYRFSDQQILDALIEGMDMLWPEIWTPQPFDTTSVLPSPIQWEYPLPAAYQDPRTTIQEVEIMPPSAFIIFTRKSGWRFINDSVTPTLIFERPPPPGGVVRITFITPYSALSQVPSIAQFLPVYYAVAKLLADQEVMRSRADDLPALTAENAGAEKGGSLQTAAWWLQNMFQPALKKLSLGYPARRSVMYRAVEKLNLGAVWQGAA